MGHSYAYAVEDQLEHAVAIVIVIVIVLMVVLVLARTADPHEVLTAVPVGPSFPDGILAGE